jgi:cytochrome c5
VSQNEDQTFFDTFMGILGALVLFTVAMIALANTIAGNTIGRDKGNDPAERAAKLERISPLGAVLVAGETAPAPAMPAAAPAPVVASAPKSGEQVYNMGCTTCHGAGIAGAPKVGDAAAWEARIAQDMDTIYGHAINGYVGENGVMPAKGGLISLSDDEVRAAVDYMLENSK